MRPDHIRIRRNPPPATPAAHATKRNRCMGQHSASCRQDRPRSNPNHADTGTSAASAQHCRPRANTAHDAPATVRRTVPPPHSIHVRSDCPRRHRHRRHCRRPRSQLHRSCFLNIPVSMGMGRSRNKKRPRRDCRRGEKGERRRKDSIVGNLLGSWPALLLTVLI